MDRRKSARRVVLLLGALAPVFFLTPISVSAAGTASPTLTPAAQAITNAIDQACATGVYTVPSAPGVPTALIGKSVPVSGCSQFESASAASEGVSPATGVGGGYCTASSGGFDDGSNGDEYGFTIQNCSAKMDLLEAWNTDYFRFNGQTQWITQCSDNYSQSLVDANDSYCQDFGDWSGTNWRVRGRSEIILPLGYLWVSVQPGCTGVGTETELCMAAAPGFTGYWNG
jgi:hypothetical protein